MPLNILTLLGGFFRKLFHHPEEQSMGGFSPKLHIGFPCRNWTVSSAWSCQSISPLSFNLALQQRRLEKWQPSPFFLFCCQGFSCRASTVNFTYSLSGTCSWYKKMLFHIKSYRTCISYLLHIHTWRVINPIRPRRAYAHPWREKAQSWQCYIFWLPLCIYLYRLVHVCSVIIWYHWIQDSWSYKLILSAYLCDRNVEALLWLNRSFT